MAKSKTTNYFKVWNRRTRFLGLEFFDDSSSISTSNAFDRILQLQSAKDGEVSLYKYPFVSGPWQAIPLVGGLV